MGVEAQFSKAPLGKNDMLEQRERLLVAINQAELMGFEGTKEALIEILRLTDARPLEYTDPVSGD